MASVTHFVPASFSSLICCKGGLHEQQPLNLVCLDPLCRSSPLSCCVCFSQIHKYHKVVGLNKFVDDYKRNISTGNTKVLQNKITRHYIELKQKMAQFKLNLAKQIENFDKAIDKYAEYLSSQSFIRTCVGQQLNIQLQPDKLSTMRSQTDLEKSVRFIINNCLYDSNLNMINTSDILKQNQERVCALLDKMVYMTDFCQKSINDSIKQLQFANETIREQKKQINKKINRLMNGEPQPCSLANFVRQKNSLKKLIQQRGCLVLEQQQKVEYMDLWNSIPDKMPDYLFGKYRCKQLQLSNNGTTVRSSIHNQKPQYALVWPNINLLPHEPRQWFMRIKKCRDFASENTMALGICTLSDMKLLNFEGHPTNCLIVSSQGYVTLNNKKEKTNFTFRQGDSMYFKYDPYYGLLEVTKQNGRKLTLRSLGSEQPVYACVRLTYASDQVQLV